MARSVWQGYAVDAAGAVLDGAQVTVSLEAGGSPTIYEQQSGGSTKANPFTTGSDGLIRFFMEPDTPIRIDVTKDSITSSFRFVEVGTAKQPEQLLADFGDLSILSIATVDKGGTGATTAAGARSNLDVLQRRDTVETISDITSLSALNTASLVDGQLFQFNEVFWPDAGNGDDAVWEWQATTSKTLHNGGTIRDPDKVADLDTGTRTFGAWFTAAGSGQGVLVRKDNGKPVPVTVFGVLLNGSDDREPTQNAWNYSASSGKQVFHPSGMLGIGSTGGTIEGVDYGLILKPGTNIVGEGVYASIITALSDTNLAAVVSERPCDNLTLDGFTIDGDSPNNPSGQMNIWIKDCTGLHIGRIRSRRSEGFGMRFENINKMFFDSLEADNISDSPGTDGIHFYDVRNVVGNKIISSTKGDDAVIFTAQNDDLRFIKVSEIIATAPLDGPTAAGRGVLVNLGDFSEQQSIQRKIYDVTLDNIQTYDCRGIGTFLAWAQFENVSITCTDRGSRQAFGVDGSTTNVTGHFRNCDFKATGFTPVEIGVDLLNVGAGAASVSNSKIDFTIYDPGDGFQGAVIRGSDWTGRVSVDYDPLSSKPSPEKGVDVFCTDSVLDVNCKGANPNINIRASASNVHFRSVNLSDAVTNSMEINSLATGIRVGSGSLGGDPVSKLNGQETKFFGTTGADTYGTAAGLTPDASGDVVIAHGLVGSPEHADACIKGASLVIPTVLSLDATNITVRLRDYSGAAVTSGTYEIKWRASL